jgi:hypothetical protein
MYLKTTAAVLAAALVAASAVPASAQHWRHGGHHHHRHGGNFGAGIAGFAAGALIGGALASQSRAYYPPGYGYGGPAYVYGGADDGEVAYCQSRFKSYDPASGTYLGYDGQRHPCP